MANKETLTAEALALGLDVPEDATNKQIKAAIAEAKQEIAAAAGADGIGEEPTPETTLDAELLVAANLLGVVPVDGSDDADLQAQIGAVRKARPVLVQAIGLGVEDAAQMTEAQLSVVIEGLTEKRVRINVANDVVTVRSIAVEAGVIEMTATELAATGLLPHQYELLDAPKPDA